MLDSASLHSITDLGVTPSLVSQMSGLQRACKTHLLSCACRRKQVNGKGYVGFCRVLWRCYVCYRYVQFSVSGITVLGIFPLSCTTLLEIWLDNMDPFPTHVAVQISIHSASWKGVTSPSVELCPMLYSRVRRRQKRCSGGFFQKLQIFHLAMAT